MVSGAVAIPQLRAAGCVDLHGRPTSRQMTYIETVGSPAMLRHRACAPSIVGFFYASNFGASARSTR
jgi:hypothetical protein